MPVAFVFDVDIQLGPENALHILPQELAGERDHAVQVGSFEFGAADGGVAYTCSPPAGHSCPSFIYFTAAIARAAPVSSRTCMPVWARSTM